MGMIVVTGMNNGYPYAEGLPETPSFAPVPPYPEYFMRVRGNSYPSVVYTPPLPGELGLSSPYPEFMLRCLGDEFNSGYPLIMQLHGIQRETFSDLFFSVCAGSDLYFASEHVSAAYCNGQKVFGTRYITQQ